MPAKRETEIQQRNGPTISAAILRVATMARRFAARGVHAVAGNYSSSMANVSEADVRPLKTTKDELSQVLRRSRERPQFVHVQGRRGSEDAEYVILPVERFNEILEAVNPDDEDDYVPVTELLAEVGRARELPRPALPKHGERAEELKPLQVYRSAK